MLRHRIRHLLTGSPLRAVAGPAFELGVAGEVLVADQLERRAPDTSLDRELTALVKTFERPHIVARLVKSIRRRYPSLPIIVVDDSRSPEPLPSVETIVLPFDSGVSAGRQAGLDRVQTPYVLVLDDDFIFYRGTHLAPAVRRIAGQPAIDILGGQLIDLPLLRRREPPIGQIFPTAARPLVPIGSKIDNLPVCDKVANFYIARTERLRLVGWDAVLRRVDHADFFTRALGVLVSVFDRELRCLHAQTPFDARYMAHRLDVMRDQAILATRWRRR